MPAKNPKPDAISPGVAATQADWHCRQAVAYFNDSSRNNLSPIGRAKARKAFIENARHALATLGLEKVLDWFGRCIASQAREYEPILRQLWAEQSVSNAGGELPSQPVAPGSRGALVNAQRLLTIALEQIEAALRVSSEQPGDVATIETRRAG